MMGATHKRGFSMFVALAIIIVMATVGAFVVSLSSKGSRTTVVQYKREQAVLLARSFTELAIMAVTANDRNDTYSTGNNCLYDIDANNVLGNESQGGYEVHVRLFYIGDARISNCPNTRIISSAIITPQSPLNVIVDVYVRYKDEALSNQWVTYHRRTVQKI